MIVNYDYTDVMIRVSGVVIYDCTAFLRFAAVEMLHFKVFTLPESQMGWKFFLRHATDLCFQIER